MVTDGSSEIKEAVAVLESGGIIAYPTEGVFGLGCDPANTGALERILQIKQRDAAKGLILAASELNQLLPYVEPFSDIVESRVLPTWPGPVTWIVPAKTDTSSILTGGRKTLAVRVSNHPVITALCGSFGQAIVSTSANLAGDPPCLSAKETQTRLGEHVDLVIHADTGNHNGATKIMDAASGERIR